MSVLSIGEYMVMIHSPMDSTDIVALYKLTYHNHEFVEGNNVSAVHR